MQGATRLPAIAPGDRDRLADVLRQGGSFCALLPPTGAIACLAWGLHEAAGRTIVCVTDGPRTQDRLFRDATTFADGREEGLAFYPAWEALPGHGAPPHPDLVGDRLATLRALAGDAKPALVITCVQALMQRALARDHLATTAVELAPGAEIDMDPFLARLADAGFDLQPEVQRKGQAAHRGGIVDIWPASEEWPVRVELFGTAIESIRAFDPATQMSRAAVARVRLSPAAEPADRLTASFVEHVPADAVWLWCERESIDHHAAMYAEVIRDCGAQACTIPLDETRDALAGGVAQIDLVAVEPAPGAAHEFAYTPFEGLPVVAGAALQPDVLERQRVEFLAAVQARAQSGWRVELCIATEGARERFAETYGKRLGEAVSLRAGALSEGFQCDALRWLVLAEEDVYGRRKEERGRYDLHAKRKGPAAKIGERIAEWTDLQPGDYVVHVDHGIGKYLGLYEIEFNGQLQEVLTVEYADKAKLYLPVAQTHLLSRYVGLGRGRPELHALGGKRWQREKEAAQKAVQDLAAQLLETQAARDALPGHAFPPDTPWQHEFEASFPYRETPDQERAILDVKRDMEAKRPMDRLVCGDVGYGKTEVAMRAAFKAVMDGRQVALLVPTTVLAQQHYDTFTARMAAYPVRVEMLTRFQSRQEQSETVARANEGAVDIVIGTHRILQPDLLFKDLGLVIVDEEQRFGVAHKEHFKRLRRMVDVLTLTATPIPRTLYMSLTGAKDLSTIETPPMERLPVETIVVPNTDALVREAILREINREGQVYYLHNRVRTIHEVHERLKQLVPEARIEVAHGQMPEDQLSTIMHAFVRGAFDVLLCTTIIESGLDIPNVNTILIDRSDRFGLAELYQLRGRVGRYKRKAYAYFLLPKHGALFDAARKRITAIRKYSQLGAGFRLALRDLEIRGAGNMLGAQQSGHITAVGFDLYCQLLQRTVAAMKGEKLPPVIDCDLKLDFVDLSPDAADDKTSACIPRRYIEDEALRLRVYRQIAGATAVEQVAALEREIADRFGRLPAALKRLFGLARLRVAASLQNIRRIEVDGDKVMMTRRRDFIMPNGRFPRLSARGATQKIEELLKLVRTV